MVVLVVFLLAAGAGTASAELTINSCTTIDTNNAPSDGLVLLGSDITGASQDSCVNVTVSNIVFDGQNNVVDGDGSGDAGIKVSNTSQTLSNVTVRNVNSSDWGFSVNYDDVNGGEIRGVNATPVASPSTAIAVTGSSSRVHVRNNDVNDGIIGITPVSESVVENNTISSSIFEGISATTTTTNLIVRNNDLNGVSGTGILLDNNGGNSHVESNDVTSAGQDGIEITGGQTNVTVAENNISDAGANGALIDGATNITLENNNVTASTNSGIKLVSDSDKTEVTGNTVLGNNQDGNSPSSDAGIFVNDSANVEVLGNTVRNNQEAGMSILFGDGIEVRDNRITENCGGQFGVRLGETSDALFVGNNISNNTGVGMQVFDASPNLTVRDSKFNDNGGLGGFQDEPGATLVNVTANGNDNYGLSLSQNTTLRDGEVRNNGGRGILANDGSTTLEDVVVSDNGQEEIDFDGPTTSSATNLTVGTVRYASLEAKSVLLEETVPPQPSEPTGLARVTNSTDILPGTYMNNFANATFSYTDTEAANVKESTIGVYEANGTGWSELSGSSLDTGANEVNVNITSFSTFALFGEESSADEQDGCIDRRNLSRGQEGQECPTDRTIERDGSREDLDRESGRRSDTSRRDRGRSSRGR